MHRRKRPARPLTGSQAGRTENRETPQARRGHTRGDAIFAHAYSTRSQACRHHQPRRAVLEECHLQVHAVYADEPRLTTRQGQRRRHQRKRASSATCARSCSLAGVMRTVSRLPGISTAICTLLPICVCGRRNQHVDRFRTSTARCAHSGCPATVCFQCIGLHRRESINSLKSVTRINQRAENR